jgi:Protein of unknown function (DUF3300)/Chaperone of endosialidase
MTSSVLRALGTCIHACALALVVVVLVPSITMAQTANPSPAAAAGELLKAEQIEALVAPIALYPDTLLAQVLMASTYPLEIVQADRWAREHKNLTGDALEAEADKRSWDESVKSLVATPSVLEMMSTKLDWTQKLGDAVLAQEPDVMDAIQRLRSKAHANNKLTTTKEQKVAVTREQDKQVIAIEPASPDAVYVPYYDPGVVYGAWPYPDYPPYYFAAPSWIPAGIIATGIGFGAAYALGRWVSGGYWGGRVNWGGNHIEINRGAHVSHWEHNALHRQGVRYNNANVRQRFGNNNLRAGREGRLDFRGRGGQQVLRPGGDRGGRFDRGPGGGPNLGDRGPGDRLGAGGERPRPKQAGRMRPASAASRPRRDNAFGNMQSGNRASQVADRGRSSLGSSRAARTAGARGGGRHVGRPAGGGGHMARRGGGGRHMAARRGGGGRHMAARRGGGGFRGGGRGGRRSDLRLKHDIILLGRLDNGLGFYRFVYNGGSRAYVGVMAQEVQTIAPEAVARGPDGYLRVRYHQLGLTLQTYDDWLAAGARVPVDARLQH